ncbi:MAG: endonuclease III [Defluviitaleaceae bacterium]|nr:endonuclease III [Defluviitaleaceae bacterium]
MRFLNYETPWQLLVATILSAQCTDARVNMVTPGLFAKYPGIDELAEADLDELAREIRPTGFHRSKAGHIIGSMQTLRDGYGGVMPDDIDILTTFPGVGRKTGNLVIGHIYGIPGIVVDTHVMRVSARLGLTSGKNPVKIERELMKALPEEHWIRFNTQIIAHGRAVCTARPPKCGDCILSCCCGYFLGGIISSQ